MAKLESFRELLTLLRDSQKSARGVSPYSKFVNRPAGRVLAAGAALTPLTPNQVSCISFGATSVAMIMLVTLRPSPILGLAVWLALAVGFMLDSADGQLARLRGLGSPAGEWLDHTLDAAKLVAIHSAVLVSWYRFIQPDDDRLLLVPLVFQFAAVVMFAGGTLAEIALRGRRSPADSAPSRARSLVLMIGDYGVFCLVFLFLGWPSLFVAGYTLLAVGNVLLVALLVVRWFRQLSELGRPAGRASTRQGPGN